MIPGEIVKKLCSGEWLNAAFFSFPHGTKYTISSNSAASVVLWLSGGEYNLKKKVTSFLYFSMNRNYMNLIGTMKVPLNLCSL